MKKLYLLRHAEAANPQGVGDHKRPLTENGKRMCKMMSQYLAEKNIAPEVVLCSDALRTMTTAKEVFSGRGVKITANKKLYNANLGVILKELAKIGDDVVEMMVVGHNPAMQQLVLMLARPEDRISLQAVKAEYPPCTLTGYSFNISQWCEVEPGYGQLEMCIKTL
jgi:phosphohistidine phosphatase